MWRRMQRKRRMQRRRGEWHCEGARMKQRRVRSTWRSGGAGLVSGEGGPAGSL